MEDKTVSALLYVIERLVKRIRELEFMSDFYRESYLALRDTEESNTEGSIDER